MSDARQYALLVVQAGNDDDDCIGNTLGKLTHIVKIETSSNFSTLENFVKFYIAPYLSVF